jgi:hypothetical protein
MRQQIRFGLHCRSQERSFFTEAQILKFTKPRNQDDLKCLMRTAPDSTDTKAVDTPTITGPSRPLALAKRVPA